MLILTLKENERVMVPVLGIVITIARIKGNRVRIGLEAPKTIKFLREKLMPKESNHATAIDE